MPPTTIPRTPRARRDLLWPPLSKCAPGQARRPKMGENEHDGLKELVIALCRTFGLRVYHTHNSKHSTEIGFPDLVITGPAGTLYRELKGDGENPTGSQSAYLADLTASGQDAGWWNPDDWYSGRVRIELEALRRAGAPVATPGPVAVVDPIRRKDIHTGLGELVDEARERIGAGPTAGLVWLELEQLKRDLAAHVDDLVERALAEGHRGGAR
jgi:hypothetical protein